MRKYYLDNLRWLIILLLFPYHVLLIYSNIGSYYFHAANSVIANTFILSLAPWFMQLLFTIAGIATYYSLKKRSASEYLKERISKLLIPTVAGIILVIPVSVYFGSLYSGYTGSFLAFYSDFFIHWLPNLKSGLIIGHLWFLLYLFIVSLVALPIIIEYKNGKWKVLPEKVTIPKLLLLIIALAFGSLFLNLYPEKSIIQFFLVFIFGYFLLANEEVQRKLEDKRWPLFISFLAITVLYLLISVPNLNSTGNSNTEFSFQSILGAFIMKIFENSIMWLGVLGVMGIGKHYLEFKNLKTLYLSAVSFPIYIFHLAWINIFAYYIINWIPNQIPFQIILIMCLGFIFTIATIEVVRRIKGFRFLFGIKG
ncbi:MAG TPA: acyltransferase family protein [Methanobacteriales archaeon]|nr:MAG: Putative membrane protein [Methanobacteriaceae archaeon 41_258]MBC7089868.1 acyltransferase family protein [Methanobacteriaceae archaeon]HIH62207.1 acyltransferase family protein [Methanobacteriales archaeon]